jgi:hypothetical protein
MRLARILVVMLFAGSSAAGVEPDVDAVAASSEPMWQTVLLAPARIVGHGRFDAAAPSYHARRAAAERTEADAAQAERCAGCPCESGR